MKNKLILTTVSGILLILFFMQSCMKDIPQPVPSNEADISALKANGVALNNMELLGKNIFFDKISTPNNQSCASCHNPDYGFTGPNSGQNLISGIYRGAIASRAGNRKPPSAAYATSSPVFHLELTNPEEPEGLFVGGNFWDGRATGERLGNPAAEQALGPFLNPVEQNHPSREAVLMEIAQSNYAALWMNVWGEPIRYATPEQIAGNYDRVGLAIAAYEGSAEVNQFSSKYDYYLKGMAKLTEEENRGMILFNGKGKCNACHPGEGEKALFTDFTFDNLGVPKNPDNPFYSMNNVYLANGQPINPEGSAWVDPGLGGFLMGHPNQVFRAMAVDNWGKHKVPTLRNVDKQPGKGNTKAYMHNGVFKSLEEVVHFYNTRDIISWPSPEVTQNLNGEELGDLQLTPAEERAIVVFMKTLSDGYKLNSKDVN